MFQDFNHTIRSKSQTQKDFKKSSTSFEKIIPTSRRDKLKELLLIKFMKKYGLKDSEDILDMEIERFIRNERLTDKDLKKFDDHLKKIISEKRTMQSLRNNLSLNRTYDDGMGLDNKLPNIDNDNMSVMSKRSKMSGASKLSTFSDMNEMKRAMKKANYKDFREEAELYNQRAQNSLNLDGDNWDAINKYNQKNFEEEKVTNKIKDKEIKRRIKEDLDVQMREKVLRSNAELQRAREFDNVVLKHVENLNELERQKELEIKKKILREKECRDNQLKDEVKKRKIEAYKNKKYEREIGTFNNI